MITHVSALFRGRTVSVPIEDVTHFTSGDKYVTAFHQGGELIISDTLKHLEAELGCDFIRTHRSFLARSSLIKWMQRIDCDNAVCKLSGVQKLLPASNNRRPAVKALLDKGEQ